MDNYEAMLVSLQRFCRSANVPFDRVVVGGSGTLGATGVSKPDTMEVWTDVLSFELFAKVYNSVSRKRGGVRVLKSWAPFGDLEVRTGPWVVAEGDFSGMGETADHHGFLHWDLWKTYRWLKAVGLEKEVKLLERARCSCGSFDPPVSEYPGEWPSCPSCKRV